MLDSVGLKILKILQDKARIPNVEVARQVGMAPSAVLERIRKLERQGYIDGYEVRLNPSRFGKTLVAFISVIPDTVEMAGPVAEMLAAFEEVQEVHFVGGEDALLVKARVADAPELGRLVRERIGALEGVCRTRSRIVMDTYTETARISINSINSEEM